MSNPASGLAGTQTPPSPVPVPLPPNPYGGTRTHPSTTNNPSPAANANRKPDINVKDRDPYSTNQHLKIAFNDIFAEPEPRTYSFDRVWTLSQQVFTSTKLWSYRVLSLICALPCAACWAVTFGCLSFFHIWFCAPCLKSCQIQLRYIRQILRMAAHTFIAPIVDAFGYCFSHIRFTWSRQYVDEDDSSQNEEKLDDVHFDG